MIKQISYRRWGTWAQCQRMALGTVTCLDIYIQVMSKGRTKQFVSGFKTIFIIVIARRINKCTGCCYHYVSWVPNLCGYVCTK